MFLLFHFLFHTVYCLKSLRLTFVFLCFLGWWPNPVFLVEGLLSLIDQTFEFGLHKGIILNEYFDILGAHTLNVVFWRFMEFFQRQSHWWHILSDETDFSTWIDQLLVLCDRRKKWWLGDWELGIGFIHYRNVYKSNLDSMFQKFLLCVSLYLGWG